MRKSIYWLSMTTAVLIALALAWNLIPQHPSAGYVSRHPASTAPPLMGLSPDSRLNVGDAVALDALPGVGEVIAARIIELRDALGGFRLPEDILFVKGIGDKKYADIMQALDEPLLPLPEQN